MAAVLILGSLALPSATAEAAQTQPADRAGTKASLQKVTALAAKDPETTSSIQPDDDDGYCSRSRKRLWVEGEGWIVRRVTTCY